MTSPTQAEAIALIKAAKNHIISWWRPEGDLPPAKSYEIVDRLDTFLFHTASIEQAEPVAWQWMNSESSDYLKILKGKNRPDIRSSWRPLYAAPQAAVPDGWKLVPLVPTQAMCQAAKSRAEEFCHLPDHLQRFVGIYKAFINAAPSPQDTKEKG